MSNTHFQMLYDIKNRLLAINALPINNDVKELIKSYCFRDTMKMHQRLMWPLIDEMECSRYYFNTHDTTHGLCYYLQHNHMDDHFLSAVFCRTCGGYMCATMYQSSLELTLKRLTSENTMSFVSRTALCHHLNIPGQRGTSEHYQFWNNMFVIYNIGPSDEIRDMDAINNEDEDEDEDEYEDE